MDFNPLSNICWPKLVALMPKKRQQKRLLNPIPRLNPSANTAPPGYPGGVVPAPINRGG